MMLNTPTRLQTINHPVFSANKLEVFMKRDDEIHPEISGNKWRKLKFNIEKFRQGKYDKILTFGGAYSNHIAATAKLGQMMNIPTIGIIRGNELNENSNETLRKAAENLMALHFVDRETYQYRYERWYHEDLRNQFGNVLIIEEGGANFLGMIGCAEIVDEVKINPDYMVTAAGTGTTLSGLLYGSECNVIGIPVFKNGGFIAKEVEELLKISGLGEYEVNEKQEKLHLETRFHFGGYGKYNKELIDFINAFYTETSVKLDQVYTGKMVYSFMKMIEEGHFKPHSKIVLLHTGGLQGLSSVRHDLTFEI